MGSSIAPVTIASDVRNRGQAAFQTTRGAWAPADSALADSAVAGVARTTHVAATPGPRRRRATDTSLPRASEARNRVLHLGGAVPLAGRRERRLGHEPLEHRTASSRCVSAFRSG